MIQSYFFIPGNHSKLFDKLETTQADFLIIDIEDSISQNDFNDVLNKIVTIQNKHSLFVRPRLFDGLNPAETTFKILLKSGFRNFIIPKFICISELIQLEDCIIELSVSDVKVILLIENPQALFSLQEILLKTKLNVVGIGFGSQDYCNETGMKHTTELLKYPRFMISGIAKAFGKTSIDIACMDIRNDEIYLKEIEDAESMGFDAKFVIHPRQLELIRNYKFHSDNEIFEAATILAEYERLGKPSVFVFNGRAVEPPHISNYRKIINWNKKYGS